MKSMKMIGHKSVIEEGLNNIMTFRKTRVSLEKISIAYWEYSTVHDWHFSIGLGRVKAIKDRLQTAIDELK
jgi:hypothetical protein